MGAIKVDNGSVEVGMIVAFINYLTIIMNSLITSSNVLMQITRAFPSAGRIEQVLSTEEDVIQSNQAKEVLPVRGEIECRDVSFSYSKNGEYVLNQLNFHVKSGGTLGIIGSTGSGKSSLVKLLPRLYEADKGTILLNGVDIKEYDLSILRESIGFIPQKAILFSGTIRENLKMGKECASEEELEKAIANAQASSFVHRLDGGLDYQLTQGATNLSGGQKQRIAIARAFVRKPAILVVDDATSAVDALSEAAIQDALRTEFKDSTKIIISSKISSVQSADQIIVMEDGCIVGAGTHAELLSGNEVYQEIYSLQVNREVSGNAPE